MSKSGLLQECEKPKPLSFDITRFLEPKLEPKDCKPIIFHHSLKLIKQHTRVNGRLHFFSVRVIDAWNSLPPEVVESRSYNVFKSRLCKVDLN
jgi:hypothetical protein